MYIRADELKVGDLVSGGEVVNIAAVGKLILEVTIESELNDEQHKVRLVNEELIFVKY